MPPRQRGPGLTASAWPSALPCFLGCLYLFSGWTLKDLNSRNHLISPLHFLVLLGAVEATLFLHSPGVSMSGHEPAFPSTSPTRCVTTAQTEGPGPRSRPHSCEASLPKPHPTSEFLLKGPSCSLEMSSVSPAKWTFPVSRQNSCDLSKRMQDGAVRVQISVSVVTIRVGKILPHQLRGPLCSINPRAVGPVECCGQGDSCGGCRATLRACALYPGHTDAARPPARACLLLVGSGMGWADNHP